MYLYQKKKNEGCCTGSKNLVQMEQKHKKTSRLLFKDRTGDEYKFKKTDGRAVMVVKRLKILYQVMDKQQRLHQDSADRCNKLTLIS